MANVRFLCMVVLISIMHIFLVKAIDCAKDLIRINLWQNLAGAPTSERHHLFKCATLYGYLSLTENPISKGNKKTLMQSIKYAAKIVFIWLLFYWRSFEEQQAHGPHLLTWVNSYKSLSMHFSLLVVMFLPNYPFGYHSNQSNSAFWTKMRICCRGLLKQHVYKTFVNISAS